MALRLVGAVGIKVRPDTSRFREETQQGLNKEIGPKGERLNNKVELDVDADTTKAKVKVTKLAEEVKNKEVKLNVGVDYDGVQKAKEQINQALKSLDNKVISFKMDKEGLAAAKAEIAKLEKNAKVEMKIVRDEAGYQSVLKKIQDIRNQKGLTKVVKFATDKASLKKAEKEALEGLKRLEAQRKVTIGYSNNYDGILNAIGEIDKRLEDVRKLKIETKLDADSLEAAKAKLIEQAKSAPVTIKFNEDRNGYETILSRIKEIQRQRLEKEITFKTDEASLDEQTRLIKDKLRKLTNLGSDDDTKFRVGVEESSLVEAEHKAKELKKKIDDMKAAISVGVANHIGTAAELAYLGRDRVVNYIARVNQTSIAAAEGALKGIGGMNILSSFGNSMAEMIGNFDTLSLKASTLATVLGSLANAGTYAGLAVVRIGEGVGQSLGLLAAAPAVLGAATVGYTIFTAAFNNFFDAFNKDPKIAKAALAELPPLARKTVDSITGLYKGLANPIQEKFWARVGTTLSDAIEKLYPNLKEKLLQSTEAVGDFVAGFGRSMTKLSLTSDFDKMFAGFNGFFVNLSGASEPFFDAWNKFGVQGATLLPRFGQWIADAAKRFDEWTTKAAANGRILDWIEHGVNSFQNMWQVGGSVIDMFKAINRAADAAGMGGLSQFNINMRKAADNMLAEPWQSRAANIFDGAIQGAHNLSDGFHDLTGTLGESSKWLGTVLTQLGSIGGAGMSRLSDLLGRKTYQEGITAELTGLQTLVDNLGPAFMGLGDVIGNMGKISGSVLGSFAPVLNQIMGLLDSSLTKMTDNLMKVAPKAVATFSGILGALTPVIVGVLDALNGVLGIIAAMPSSFITLGAAAAAFFALRGLASKFFESFQQTDKFKTLEGNWLAQQTAAGKTVDSYRMVNGEMQKFTVPTEKFSATRALWSEMSTSVGGVREQIRMVRDDYATMARGIQGQGLTAIRTNPFAGLQATMTGIATVTTPMMRTALSGLFDALGGPWGLAIGAASIAIGLFAQKQADTKADTDAMTAAIDKQTGAMNRQGLEQIAKRWTDVGKAQDGFANLMRGSTKAANETVGALGLSISDMTLEVSKGGDAAHGLSDKWQNLGDKMKVLEGANHVVGRSLDQVRGDAESAAAALGLNVEQIQKAGIHGDDILHVANNLKEEADKATVARLVFEELGKSTGETGIQAQQMAAAMQTIGDNSTDAASKIGAINKALDLLKGGTQSAREAEVNAQATFQSSVQQAASIRDELAKNNHLIDQSTGLIDVTSTSGLKLQQTMSTAANGIKVAAMAAYQAAKDAGKPPEEAMAAAQKVLTNHKDDLLGIATAAGVDVQTIQKEWDGFFGKKWELNAVFSASADKFQAAKKIVEDAGLEWNDKTFEALLSAIGDPAKATVDEVKQKAIDYANGQYEAVLKAMNQQALAVALEAVGAADAYKKGDYTGVMKALNSTDPGVQAAWSNLMGVVGGPNGAGWKAAFQAYLDAQSAANTEQALKNLAGTRYASIIVSYKEANRNPGLAAMQDGIDFPNHADGGISYATGKYLKGFGPTSYSRIQQFANGGFSGLQFEKPGPARIYPGSSTWRVFAEQTTGGEAFIPLAASKRNRSTAILAQVAQQFGYKLQKAQAFEDGGIVAGGNSRAAGLQISIDTFNQNANDTIEDVGRGIMRQVRNAGMVGITDGI